MLFDTATTPATAPGGAKADTLQKRGRTVALPVAFGLGLAAIAATFTSLNSETVVATGFERAFAALQKPPSQVASRPYDGVVGSEEFWLTANKANADLIKAVAVGQQLTVSANGTERHLTITSVHDADDAVTHIQTTVNGALLVTCRDGATGRDVRLRVDASQIVELPAEPNAQRAL